MSEGYEKRLLRVIGHIHANPAGDLSLDALADVAAMSRFHWHRVFHAMTGETAAEAVRRVRMHRATCWLVRKDWPVAEVAKRVGYPNARSFARTFAEAYGITPLEFRIRGEMDSPLAMQQKGDRMTYDVTIREEPPRRMAAMTHRGPYPEIGEAFEKASTIIGARGLFPQVRGMLGVYHDDPSAVPPADLRSHAGFELADEVAIPEGVEEVTLEGGRAAVLCFKGHYSGLPAAYDYLFGEWLSQSGEEPRDAPTYEVYLNSPMDTAPDDLLTEICVPLK